MKTCLIIVLFSLTAALANGQSKKAEVPDKKFEELLYRIDMLDLPLDLSGNSLGKSIPEQLVQTQNEGYNNGDLNNFIQPYHDEVELYVFPDQLILKGKENLLQYSARKLDLCEQQSVEVIKRTVMDNTVIDQQRITSLYNGEEREEIVIYRIRDEKIFQVYKIQ
ncbi:nuclear transport factor 2 family protein [Fulvivirga sedimenti]|uniref:SnoaL-like domain-containing protein n=1 Tax=Fulvivirga sedimenti TaxID=2879465 RepID=A0A9X1L1T8_9BACT|nr:nuclear transport factor 2 family protein [Fulvivirga sedimenti]MCA6079069.1 hypothetical protein [Fulvivirga sedimenti]